MLTIAEKTNPFTCKADHQITQLLHQGKFSLAISTYQAGKMIFVSAPSPDRLVQLPRTFSAPMGIAVNGKTMSIACKNEIVHLVNTPGLAKANIEQPGKYDTMFVPRSMYMTGPMSIHDMAYTSKGLMAVNTAFSCLCMFDGINSFTPVWKPSFISDLKHEDRCHLNGIAVEKGTPKYVTSLGSTNTEQGWRQNKMNGGLLMDLSSGEIILDGLSMPHSPRLVNGRLLVLNSAQGELIEVNTGSGTYKVLLKTGAFLRGMSQFGDYLFIGSSKLRHNTEAFRGLPIADSSFAGLIVVKISEMKEIARLEYMNSVDEIYDVKVIPNAIRPGILNYPQTEKPLPISSGELNFWPQKNDNK